jgi:hypothetical protein
MRFVASAVLAIILMAAEAAYPHSGDGLRGDVSVEVISDQGNTLLTVPHRDLRKDGTHIIKQYVEARKGEHYSIVIRNRTAQRIGVVVAVDGRNIISGKRSDLGRTEDMYLVNAYDQGRYDGWRTDQDTVHRFYFTDPGDSYSMRTFNDASSIGVIAVAAYREKDRPRPRQKEMGKQESAPAAPSASSAERSKSLAAQDEAAGTGFGESRFSPTVRVAFEPERTPFQKTLVKYEWRESLCRKGIVHCGTETGSRLWDEGEYAPYPPAYRGN